MTATCPYCARSSCRWAEDAWICLRCGGEWYLEPLPDDPTDPSPTTTKETPTS